MISEELKKIRSFGSHMESSVTPQDIADKEAELGFFINVIDPRSLEPEIAEVEQRLRAIIPEPLKKCLMFIMYPHIQMKALCTYSAATRKQGK